MRENNILKSLLKYICITISVLFVVIIPAMSVSLPSGYTQLEYIQSSGTQYINTGVVPSSTIGIYVDATYPSSSSTDNIVLGSRTSTSVDARFWIDFDASCAQIGFGYGNYSVRTSRFTGAVRGQRYVVSMNYFGDGYGKVDGTIYDTLSTHTIAYSSIPMYLFSGNIAGTTYYLTSTKMYSAKITEGSVLVRNFIPAKRNSDSVIGMYDTVTNTFFTNAGTGTFVAGPATATLIKIATTKYVEDKFAPSVTELNTAISTVKTVVDNTIIQADRIGKLHTGKQTRPDEQCPKGRECLLITEADGSLHWYPICDANGSVAPIED